MLAILLLRQGLYFLDFLPFCIGNFIALCIDGECFNTTLLHMYNLVVNSVCCKMAAVSQI